VSTHISCLYLREIQALQSFQPVLSERYGDPLPVFHLHSRNPDPTTRVATPSCSGNHQAPTPAFQHDTNVIYPHDLPSCFAGCSRMVSGPYLSLWLSQWHACRGEGCPLAVSFLHGHGGPDWLLNLPGEPATLPSHPRSNALPRAARSHNSLGSAGAAALAPSLAGLTCLEALDLRRVDRASRQAGAAGWGLGISTGPETLSMGGRGAALQPRQSTTLWQHQHES
jgi:hypothetical protein